MNQWVKTGLDKQTAPESRGDAVALIKKTMKGLRDNGSLRPALSTADAKAASPSPLTTKDLLADAPLLTVSADALPSEPEPAFTALHAFQAQDGLNPYWGLVADSSGWLYGVTDNETGWDSEGSIFKIRSDGTQYTILKFPTDLNGQGAEPVGTPVLSKDQKTLYGMMNYGGLNQDQDDNGTIFSMGVDGSNFHILYSFVDGSISACVGSQSNCVDGDSPWGSLVVDDTTNPATLYGTTKWGGADDKGTVFSIRADGSGYTQLYAFTGDSLLATPSQCMNSADGGICKGGSRPLGYLALKGHELYGLTRRGGTDRLVETSWGSWTTTYGTIFKLKLNLAADAGAAIYSSVEYTQLYDFGARADLPTEADGGMPSCAGQKCKEGHTPGDQSGLVFGADQKTLYGTTSYGGSDDRGTVFSIESDGSNYKQLRAFTSGDLNLTQCAGAGTTRCEDGAYPEGRLTVHGGVLFGTTSGGGEFDIDSDSFGNHGLVFRLDTTASATAAAYKIVYPFRGDLEGSEPQGDLLSYGDKLYGVTVSGGSNDEGTLFAIDPKATPGDAGAPARTLTTYHAFGSENGGENPTSELAFSDDETTLYGTTRTSLFSISATGENHTTLLPSNWGGKPIGGLVRVSHQLYGVGTARGSPLASRMPIGDLSNLSDHSLAHEPTGSLVYDGYGRLWGTTDSGGTENKGYVFSCDTTVADFTCTGPLYSFSDASPVGSPIVDPSSTRTKTVLYGMTLNSVYTIDYSHDTPTAKFVVNWTFGTEPTTCAERDTARACVDGDVDGVDPQGSLLVDKGSDGRTTVYGTTALGGAYDNGTFFSIAFPATGSPTYRQWHAFGGTHNDGIRPRGSLVKMGDAIYGVTKHGGQKGQGTIYRVSLAPGAVAPYERILSAFSRDYGTAPIVGANPTGGLIASKDGTTLFGTTEHGGENGASDGIIFSFKPANHIASGSNSVDEGTDGGSPGSIVTPGAGASPAAATSSSCSLGVPRADRRGAAFAICAAFAIGIGIRRTRRRSIGA